MKKKVVSIFLAVTLICGLLIGCGNGTEENQMTDVGLESPENSTPAETDRPEEVQTETSVPDTDPEPDQEPEPEPEIDEYTLWTLTVDRQNDPHGTDGHYVYIEVGYDAADRLILERLGNSGTYTQWKKINYDGLGRVIRETILSSRDIWDDTAAESWTIYEYDDLGNLVAETNEATYSSASRNVYEYDDSGNLIKETLERGGDIKEWTDYKYDASSNLVRKERHVPDYNKVLMRVDEYGYDSTGNLTEESSFTTQEGREEEVGNKEWIRYEYDASGNLTRETHGSGSDGLYWIEYEYDASGNLTREAHGFANESELSSWTEYEYDASGNLTREAFGSFTNGSEPSDWIEYEYDVSGNIIKRAIIGSMYRSETIYEYDLSGNCVRVSDGYREYEYEYEYDSAGKLIRATNNEYLGMVIEFEYNESDYFPQDRDTLFECFNDVVEESCLQNIPDSLIKCIVYDGEGNAIRTVEWTSEIITLE